MFPYFLVTMRRTYGATYAAHDRYVFNSSILNSKYIHTIKVDLFFNTKSEETADYALALTSTSTSLYASHFSVLGEISQCVLLCSVCVCVKSVAHCAQRAVQQHACYVSCLGKGMFVIGWLRLSI